MTSEQTPNGRHSAQIARVNELARHFNVVCNTLVYTDGRDKSMKVIQYTLSVLMITVFRKYKLFTNLHPSIDGTMAMFSDARKVVRLANFTGFFSKLVYLLQGRGMNPLQTMSPIDTSHYPLLVIKTASEFVNGITDDLFCLSRFNVINKDLGTNAKQLSIKLWWTSLSIDFYLNFIKLRSVKNKLFKLTSTTDSEKMAGEEFTDLSLKNAPSATELRAQIYGFQLNLVKIFADMIFCGYDLFHIKSNIEFMHFSAIISGLVGYYRLWSKTNISTKA